MFLKNERPEFDNFERKKHFVGKENIWKNVQVYKKICNFFAYSFVSENSKQFFLF